MTFKEAMRILVEQAAENAAGSGVGLRSRISESNKLLVARAISVVWKRIYDRPVDDSDLRNLRLHITTVQIEDAERQYMGFNKHKRN